MAKMEATNSAESSSQAEELLSNFLQEDSQTSDLPPGSTMQDLMDSAFVKADSESNADQKMAAAADEDDDFDEDEDEDDSVEDSDDESDEDEDDVTQTQGKYNSRLVKKLNEASKENVVLKQMVRELQTSLDSVSQDKTADDFWNEFQLDPIGALEDMLTEKMGQGADVKEELKNLTYDLLSLIADDNPDLDVDPAAIEKKNAAGIKARKALKEKKLLEKKLKEKELAEQRRAQQEADVHAVNYCQNFVKQNSDKFPILSAVENAGAAILHDLRMTMDKHPELKTASDEEISDILGQIAKAHDTYHRERVQKLSALIQQKDESSDGKRKRAGSKKKTLTNDGASGSPKKKTRDKNEIPDDVMEAARAAGLF